MKILLIVYDNVDYINWFPLSIGYIAGVLIKAGLDVEIYNQDIYHYTEDHLINYLDNNKFNMVAMGSVAGYYPYYKLNEISKAINKSKNRDNFLYVLGGHMVTPEPLYFIKKYKADIVVTGEGEQTILEICNLLRELDYNYNSLYNSLYKIKGIAYSDIINEDRPQIKDINEISFPAYELFPIEHYRLKRFVHTDDTDFIMPMITARGCPYNCNFCYKLMNGYRMRSSKNIIEEIKLLKKDYNINYIYFYDDLLMFNNKRVKDICTTFINENIDIKWACNGRLNTANKQNLRLMKEAGCVFINYGIESYDDIVLKNMNKRLTCKQIETGIKNTLEENISPGLNMIFGNYGDNKNTLNKSVNFILKYSDNAQRRTIRPVTPYPGCQLYYDAIKDNKLEDVKDFYDNKHLNSDLLSVNFTKLSDNKIYKLLYKANKKLLNKYIDNEKKDDLDILNKLYKERDINFRGFR